MGAHGVPEALFGPTEALWDYIGATAENFDADVRLHGRRPHPGRRSRAARGGSTGPQRDRHAVRRPSSTAGVRR